MSDILDDPAHGAGALPASDGTPKTQGSEKSKPLVWQSLSEFEGKLGEARVQDADADVAGFVGREFPTDDFDSLDGVDRRRFFQILGASAALAGASSCRWEKENILPFKERPEETVPGKPKVYASVMDLAGAARPLTVQSYDGRPIKIEPNERVGHGTDVYSQAEVLGFWDPDRTRTVGRNNGDGTFAGASWDDAVAALRGKVAEGGVAVLASTNSSPTLARLAGDLAGRGVQWTWWSPVGQDNAVAGAEMAFGRPLRARYDLEAADVVVALDCDFQRLHPDAVRLAGDFALRRMPEGGRPMSRLYAVESRFTSAGVTADHRLPVRSADVGAVLELIEAALTDGTATGGRAVELGSDGKVTAFVDAVAQDIRASGGSFAILTGESQAPEVHARVHGIHAAQGAVGKGVDLIEEPLAAASTAALASLVADIDAGRVKTLITLGGNPAYDAPADLAFGEAMKKCATAHLSLYRDETAVLADWSLPMAHWLECWGDARSFDGHDRTSPNRSSRRCTAASRAIEVCRHFCSRTSSPATALDFGRGPRSARRSWGSPSRAIATPPGASSLHDGVVEGSRASAP